MPEITIETDAPLPREYTYTIKGLTLQDIRCLIAALDYYSYASTPERNLYDRIKTAWESGNGTK